MNKSCKKFSGIICLSLLLASCTLYHAQPLDSQSIDSHLKAPSQSQLTQQAAHLKQARLKPIKLDFSNPLTPEELAVIAVITNPDLQSLRAQQGVANAQVFNAGLLPDPQISANIDHPFAVSPSATPAYNSYSIGPTFDIGSLVTRHWNIIAAQQQAEQTHDNLAWQEWLVANQAHLLAIQLNFLEKQQALAKENLQVNQRLLTLVQKNLSRHDANLNDLDTQQTNYFDAQDQLSTLSRQVNQAKLSLNTLLGFPPQTVLNIQLTHIQFPAHMNAEKLFELARHERLDLLALQAGYQNQETQVKQAILGQFPHFTLGLTRARDTSDVNTIGFGLNFDLPLLNRNRGAIAITTAIREQLYNEYIARLQQTRSDIASLTEDLQNLQQEYQQLNASENFLIKAQKNLASAFKEREVTLTQYANLSSNLLAKQKKIILLKQTMAEQCVALQISVGTTLEGASC
jgi:cobalt-zinc-cadmium efflux system outer membrane protein